MHLLRSFYQFVSHTLQKDVIKNYLQSIIDKKMRKMGNFCFQDFQQNFQFYAVTQRRGHLAQKYDKFLNRNVLVINLNNINNKKRT